MELVELTDSRQREQSLQIPFIGALKGCSTQDSNRVHDAHFEIAEAVAYPEFRR